MPKINFHLRMIVNIGRPSWRLIRRYIDNDVSEKKDTTKHTWIARYISCEGAYYCCFCNFFSRTPSLRLENCNFPCKLFPTHNHTDDTTTRPRKYREHLLGYVIGGITGALVNTILQHSEKIATTLAGRHVIQLCAGKRNLENGREQILRVSVIERRNMHVLCKNCVTNDYEVIKNKLIFF